ncbi:hypothetical protein WT02_16705 [Burkholderia stagnalis]|nr:hypothetical protein WT03_02095 [Burkholderia stagnalis]KVL95601.1 hypothetical protein WT02_16705 [Burkholderia stagnalis]KVM14816.1 hypothetical protein WT04_07430 [Burkholderia stagnalis]
MAADHSDCRLFPFGDDDRQQQDDVIWDVRSNPATHFLLVHHFNQNLDLTQVGTSAAIRHWRENFMVWTLRELDNFRW